MPRYIDLDALLKYPIRRHKYDKENGSIEFINGVESVLEYAMDLDVWCTNEPSQGTWTEESRIVKYYRCSCCNRINDFFSRYCPGCGRKMTQEE